jgi:hypothetical protein
MNILIRNNRGFVFVMHYLLPFLLSLVLISLSSCTSQSYPMDFWQRDSNDVYDVPLAPDVEIPSPQLSVHAEEVTGIIQEMSVELRHLKRLHLEHARTYYNEEGIHTIQLQYNSQDIIELCQARRLIVDVVEELLEALNCNSELFPEFTNHAFYPFNLEVYIDFDSYYTRYVDPFYIRWISLENSMVFFYTADVIDNDKSGWHYKKETYDTAKNIVFYQRLAEDKFKAEHERNRAIFGNTRFFAEPDRPPRVLE